MTFRRSHVGGGSAPLIVAAPVWPDLPRSPRVPSRPAFLKVPASRLPARRDCIMRHVGYTWQLRYDQGKRNVSAGQTRGKLFENFFARLAPRRHNRRSVRISEHLGDRAAARRRGAGSPHDRPAPLVAAPAPPHARSTHAPRRTAARPPRPRPAHAYAHAAPTPRPRRARRPRTPTAHAAPPHAAGERRAAAPVDRRAAARAARTRGAAPARAARPRRARPHDRDARAHGPRPPTARTRTARPHDAHPRPARTHDAHAPAARTRDVRPRNAHARARPWGPSFETPGGYLISEALTRGNGARGGKRAKSALNLGDRLFSQWIIEIRKCVKKCNAAVICCM